MPTTYAYKVRDKGGRTIEGSLDAENPALVATRLRQMGYVPVAIAPKSAGMNRDISFGGGRIKQAEVAVMARQFATMIDSGLTLLKALSILAEQTESKPMRKVLTQVRLEIERGSSLSHALVQHPKAFNKLFVAMVRAGEAGGVLDSSLRQLATMIEKSVELRRKIKSAMTYPIAVLCLVVLILTAMLLFIVPQFKSIYASLDATLPLPTLILMKVSRIVSKYFPFVAVAVGIAVYMLVRATKTPKGKAVSDRLGLRLPLFGKLIHKAALTRFSRTLAALMRSGVPILEALEITKDTVNKVPFTIAIDDMQTGVKGGEAMARRMATHEVFPPMVSQMLAVGEETGVIDGMLDKVGDFYEEQVQAMVSALTSLLEPMLICVLGGAVGSMVIALYLPMFDVIKHLGG
jgi:type IV pilus assembly protein PilC